MSVSVVCFGEVLWDVLPHQKYLGGAPCNVAYHLNQLGISTYVISSIGGDKLGKELLLELENKGIPTTYIQQSKEYPTGTVDIKINNGEPSYDIVQPVAYDSIIMNQKVESVVKNSTALVYGSLAARDLVSKNTLLNCLAVSNKNIFDVNLRTPFFDKELIYQLIQPAHILKINKDELIQLCQWEGIQEEPELAAKKLLSIFNLEKIILTLGSEGARIITKTESIFKPVFPIQLKNTIGSGDAFLGTYIYHHIMGAAEDVCLEKGMYAGGKIAEHDSATPKLNYADFH